LEQLTEVYRLRRDKLCSSLAKEIGDRLEWSKPEGGMFVWCKLPTGYSARELLAFAAQEDVTFSPGDMFSATGACQEYFRLSFVQFDEEMINEGVIRLARAISNYFDSKSRSKQAANRRSEPTFV